ncbi:HupE/UreJ family protein [Paracoccus sp. NBH48]|uniref:HupE/UreJ family protein n=1 Tax=Paracoccus sp. NBH48 TaxID=2596918 RepID=UPI0021021DCA|nr:HupE/UreJ family protein [Paracoccus sp. NBH48]
MLAGGAMGAGGMGLPVVEPMILASVVILGVLVAMAARLPMAALVPMVAVFGAAHGWAHGAEGPATGLPLYAAGLCSGDHGAASGRHRLWPPAVAGAGAARSGRRHRAGGPWR